MTVPDQQKKQETHIQHLVASFGYSMDGAKRLWKEKAFQQELIAILIPLAVYALIGASIGFYIASAVLALTTVAVEALNTAVEEIIDRISPEISLTGKHAKDLGSFAVFCLLAANALVLIYALIVFL